MAWRYAALGYVFISPPYEAIDHWPVRPLLIAKSFGWYLLATINPFPLISPLHPRPAILPLTDPLAWLALGGVLLAVTAVVVLIRRAPRQGWLWAAFLLSFLPVIHLIPMTIGDNYVQDRFMVFPLVLFAVALTASLSDWLAHPHPQAKAIRWGTALVLIFFCGWSVANLLITIPLWKSNLSLWTWAAAKHPASSTAHNHLADEYNRMGNYPAALDETIKSLAVNPAIASPWTIGGNTLTYQGRYEEALLHQRTAYVIAGNEPDLLHNLATTLIRLKQYDEAETHLLVAHAGKPYNRRINTTLGLLYLTRNKPSQAKKYLALATLHLSENDQKEYWQIAENRVGHAKVKSIRQALADDPQPIK